jgi:hypothetical protein
MPDKNDPLDNLEIGRKENLEEPLPAPKEPQTPWEKIKAVLRQAGGPSQAARTPARHEMGKDRTKSLIVLAGAVVGMVLMFLGVFSSPQRPRSADSRRVMSDLGRRTTPGQTGNQSGSVTPLMDADAAKNQAELDEDQLTAADIGRTGRTAQPRSVAPTVAKTPHALSEIDFSDAAPPTPPTPTSAVAATPANNVVNKSSLVFVRAGEGSQSRAFGGQPAIERESSIADALPAGTRLVARLEAPVSSGVAAPVVAVIEYNYERDGEIVVPAGARALGRLQQSNRSGYMSLHFATLEMPDGDTEKIDAGAMGLDYKPLKGDVTGRNRGGRFLVESLTGLGTMATYLVGYNSGSFNAPFSSSALLREQLASNVGLAGQNELNQAALNQNIIVTLPGSTRFYLVIQRGATLEASPASDRPRSAQSTVPNNSVPSLEELRQLLELKREMSQMYEQAATQGDTAPQQ